MPTRYPMLLLFQQIKNRFGLFLFLLAFLSLVPSAFAAGPLLPPSAPAIHADGYLLTDFHSGEILAEKNADKRVEPASLTKMMTAYIAFSELKSGHLRMEEEVSISEKAWRTPGSRTFLEVNTSVPVEVLLKGIVVQSGNDASVALAEHIAGDESVFVQRMNQEAERMGLHGSNFMNATGLPDPNHYSTARDMAKLGAELVRNFPGYYKMHSIKSYKYNDIQQYNRNKLLWHDDSYDGIKTGHTEAAGYCLVASAQQKGMRLIAVIMGAGSAKSRTDSARSLLRYGFRFFKTHMVYKAGAVVSTVPVWKGSVDTLSVGVEDDLYITVPSRRQDDVRADMQIDSLITAPVTAGKAYGKIRITIDDESIMERPLIALEDISPGDMWKRTLDGVRLYFQ